jgi:hypothetical protein
LGVPARKSGEGDGVTDVDGKYYTSIIIQDQEWMQHNLSVGQYRTFPGRLNDFCRILAQDGWKDEKVIVDGYAIMDRFQFIL